MTPHRMLAAATALVSVLACSCSSAQDVPTEVYSGPFDPMVIEDAELIVDEIAERWKLRTFRKDRRQMAILTQGKDAFFVALYLEQHPVITLTNAGVGTVLTLLVTDFGNMPPTEIDRLTSDVVSTLEQRLNVTLTKEDPPDD